MLDSVGVELGRSRRYRAMCMRHKLANGFLPVTIVFLSLAACHKRALPQPHATEDAAESARRAAETVSSSDVAHRTPTEMKLTEQPRKQATDGASKIDEPTTPVGSVPDRR
jgi:hypothetical protein